MAHLAGKHHDLSPVMAFVGNEVAENVADVEGKVAPHIRRRGRNASPLITAEFQEVQHTCAAKLQRGDKILWFHLVPVYKARYRDAVWFAERLKPHATGVVEVNSEHPHCATWRSGNSGLPEFGGQVLNQKDGDAVVRFPCVEDGILQVK